MLWTVLVELAPESIGDWTLHPRFIEDTGGMDNPPRGSVFWAIGLSHKHAYKLEKCSVVEKEIADSGIFGKYQCSKCGERVPNSVVNAKSNRLVLLRGTDPRNDRRGAILATQKKYK